MKAGQNGKKMKEPETRKQEMHNQDVLHVPLKDYFNEPLHALMNDYYKRLAFLEQNREQPVAWITTMVPIEILHAAGVFPFYPENYSALCAARGLAKELIAEAESRNIPRDLCGYATCNIGSVFSGKWAFGKGGVPLPDLLIATRLTCNIHLNWFSFLRNHLKVPLFILDAPYRSGADYQKRDIDYFVGQLKRFIEFIEKTTGRPVSQKKLEETIELSDQASVYWSEISESRKFVPSPLGSKDVFSLMFPMVTLAGKPEPVDFYKDLAKEVKRRVKLKVCGSDKETFRLIWDLFPPWHDMKLWNRFDEAGAVFVIDLYADAFSGRLTNPDIYFSLVEKYLNNTSLERGIEDKVNKFERLVKDFSLDGAVFMSNRSCRYFSLNQLDLMTFVRGRLELPVLFFEGDHMDPNRYHRETVLRQIEVFFEVLSQKR